MRLLSNSDAMKFAIFVFVLFASALILDAVSQDGDITGQASFKSLGKKLKKEIQHAMGQLPKPPAAPAPVVCTDSDNTYFITQPGGAAYNPPGQDRYIVGTVTYGQQRYTDYCANQVAYKDAVGNNLMRYNKVAEGEYLIEMGCIDGKLPKETIPFKCLGICKNGACVKPFQPPTLPVRPVTPTTEQPKPPVQPPQQQTTQLKPISTKPQAKPAGTTVEKTQTITLPPEVGV